MKALKSEIMIFIKQNKNLVVLLFIATLIMVSYIMTMDRPELFHNAESWYNLLFQLAVGYNINFMFFLTQLYIPERKRKIKLNSQIYRRLKKLIEDMEEVLNMIAEEHLKNHPEGKDYTPDEIKLICNVCLDENTGLVKAESISKTEYQCFTVRELMQRNLEITEKEIDKLYMCFGSDLSERVILSLESILNSSYYKNVPIIVKMKLDNKVENFGENMIQSYYKEIQNMKNIIELEF